MLTNEIPQLTVQTPLLILIIVYILETAPLDNYLPVDLKTNVQTFHFLGCLLKNKTEPREFNSFVQSRTNVS